VYGYTLHVENVCVSEAAALYRARTGQDAASCRAAAGRHLAAPGHRDRVAIRDKVSFSHQTHG